MTAKSSVSFSPSLMQSEKCYISDYMSKTVAEVERIEIEKFCREIVLKAYMDIGQAKIDNTTVKLMTTGLINEVLPYKNLISQEGIKNAIEKGIRKEYGEYYGINSVSFNQFLKGYMNSTERKEAIIKQKQHEKRVLEERQMIHDMDSGQQFTLYSYDKYKEEGTIYDPANVAYDWLKSKGLVKNMSKEEKEEIRTEAEYKLTSTTNNSDGVPASAFIRERLANRGGKKQTYEEKVLALCKQIHLKKVYDYITLEQIEQVNVK
jgi:hypothetical protein